ncbi:MAG: T9SS type A sorting domain-containing protein [Bacteroidetes bacterium]|nr:T9SS type A sorting domain-containing protein [Bacteroidota bacterium]
MGYPKIIVILILLFTGNANAQYTNKVWCFGDSAGIDFNQSLPLPIATSLDSRGTCTSIADSSGNLLFYSNTRAATAGLTGLVWNRNNVLMQNGDSIYGAGWYFEHTIVPNPRGDNTYYLFTAGETSYCGFYYSMIDLNQNGGLGAVTQKNVELLGQNICVIDGLAAIKHANGRDWWVITKSASNANNEYYFYLVTPNGVNLDHMQNFGEVLQTNTLRLNPSLDGSLVSCTTANGYLTIFDFDRCSGYFTNESELQPNVLGSSAPWYWDCELSSSNQFLYVSSMYSLNDSNSYVFQYNLADTNPSLTRDTIFSIKQPVAGGLLKLGPDNRIYWSCAYEAPGIFPYPYPDSVRNVWNENLSYINFPDSLGAACDFHPFSFYLGGKRTYYGLPNNPNYELGPIVNSICDTITATSTLIFSSSPELHVSYNSSWQTLFVNAENLKGKEVQLTIYDLNGRVCFNKFTSIKSGYFTQDIVLTNYSTGLYVVSLTTEKEKLSDKVVKE